MDIIVQNWTEMPKGGQNYTNVHRYTKKGGQNFGEPYIQLV